MDINLSVFLQLSKPHFDELSITISYLLAGFVLLFELNFLQQIFSNIYYKKLKTSHLIFEGIHDKNSLAVYYQPI